MFSNYTPIHINRNNLNEEDIEIVMDELGNNKDFQKSDIEIETYESIEELKYPQEFEKNSLIILADLARKEIDDPRVQAMFKRSRHNNSSIFTISQDYYGLGKKTIRCNDKIYIQTKQLQRQSKTLSR